MRPEFIWIRTHELFCFLLRSTAQSPDKADNSTMQRACLYPQLTTKLQQAAPCACGRCALACCFYRSLRSITRSHHHHLSLPLLAACCVIVYHTTQYCCQFDSDNREQQQSSQQYIRTSTCCSLSAWAHAPHAPRKYRKYFRTILRWSAHSFQAINPKRTAKPRSGRSLSLALPWLGLGRVGSTPSCDL